MKWIYLVKIVVFLTILIINLSFIVPQSIRDYRYYDIDRYSQDKHPAVRRAKYLYGDVTPESRLPRNQNTLSTLSNTNSSPYATNEYQGYERNDLQRYSTPKPSQQAANNNVNQADKENAKFVGLNNQEKDVEESERALGHFKLKRLKRLLRNRCLPFGRDANSLDNAPDDSPDKNGRFLWGVNVYNVYPASPVAGHGCGGLLGGGGGFLGGGGPLSDPIAPAYPTSSLNNFLGLFAPGILQNALAATARPPFQFNPADNGLANNQIQTDPSVDPGFAQGPLPPQRPNRQQVYFDAPMPLTPAQLVGGVATTVNGIIQQLTGNIQPVYQQPYG